MKTPFEFIEEAGKTIKQRGTDNGYDAGQERSAAQIAAVFNALTGRDLTEQDVWTLLLCLKLVRNQRKYKEDNIVDMLGYVALLGESLDATLAQQVEALAGEAALDRLAKTPAVTHEEAKAAHAASQTKPVTPPAAGVARRALEAAKQEAKTDSPVGDLLLSGVALEVAAGTHLNRWAQVLHTERLSGESDQSLRARLIEIRKMQGRSKPRTPGRFA